MAKLATFNANVSRDSTEDYAKMARVTKENDIGKGWSLVFVLYIRQRKIIT